jgi:sugar-specific transcriptional regulator TrmB
MQDVIDLLKNMQFTEYEAKAYLALLEKEPMTGYGVALHSGVPRSKIYEVLGNMASRGDIVVSHEEPPQYSPLSPTELIQKRKRQSENLFHSAQESLKRYSTSRGNRENIWNIAGREAIMDKVNEAIKSTKHRILLELWPEEAEALRINLCAAVDSGCKVQIVAYGILENYEFADVIYHDSGEKITAQYGGRWIVCSMDDREVIAGIVSLGQDSRAAWTIHPGLVMPITEVIIHDLYIHEILSVFRSELEDRFGPNLDELRRKYSLNEDNKKYFELIQDKEKN